MYIAQTVEIHAVMTIDDDDDDDDGDEVSGLWLVMIVPSPSPSNKHTHFIWLAMPTFKNNHTVLSFPKLLYNVSISL